MMLRTISLTLLFMFMNGGALAQSAKPPAPRPIVVAEVDTSRSALEAKAAHLVMKSAVAPTDEASRAQALGLLLLISMQHPNLMRETPNGASRE